jgi:hypothetical protein
MLSPLAVTLDSSPASINAVQTDKPTFSESKAALGDVDTAEELPPMHKVSKGGCPVSLYILADLRTPADKLQ